MEMRKRRQDRSRNAAQLSAVPRAGSGPDQRTTAPLRRGNVAKEYLRHKRPVVKKGPVKPHRNDQTETIAGAASSYSGTARRRLAQLNCGYLALSRRAPSRRIVVPLSITFSTICWASSAYSLARPRRAGKGTCEASDSWAAGGMPAIIAVSNTPDYCIEEVATHSIALALAASRGLLELGIETTPPLEAE